MTRTGTILSIQNPIIVNKEFNKFVEYFPVLESLNILLRVGRILQLFKESKIIVQPFPNILSLPLNRFICSIQRSRKRTRQSRRFSKLPQTRKCNHSRHRNGGRATNVDSMRRTWNHRNYASTKSEIDNWTSSFSELDIFFLSSWCRWCRHRSNMRGCFSRRV